jgi:hypothetical protein
MPAPATEFKRYARFQSEIIEALNILPLKISRCNVEWVERVFVLPCLTILNSLPTNSSFEARAYE